MRKRKVERGTKPSPQYFIKAPEIAEILGVHVITAQKYLVQMKKELKENGIVALPGRVPRGYFYKRFGLNSEVNLPALFVPPWEKVGDDSDGKG